MAAVLAVGDGAALSHRAAAARLGLRSPPSGLIDVTVARQGGRRHKGIAVHVTRSLPASEITEIDSIPCTTPGARTLVDLAGIVSERQLGYALEATLELRIFDVHCYGGGARDFHRAPRQRLLRQLVADLGDEGPPTRQELERRFPEVGQRRAPPLPHRQRLSANWRSTSTGPTTASSSRLTGAQRTGT